MENGKEQSKNEQLSDREKELKELQEHRLRMRFDWDNLIEEKIQEGQDNGSFDRLKGKGKPLNLSKSPYGKDKTLAHSLLKDNNMTPAWIGSRKQIMMRIEQLRAEIIKIWQRHEREYTVLNDPRYRDSLVISWDDACQKWEKQIVEINKFIADYNLKRPINNLEIIKLELNRELEKANAKRWLKDVT